MKKFIFEYYGKPMSDEERMKNMTKTKDEWMAWFDSFKDKIVDGGNPFLPGAKSVTAKGVETISKDNWPATGYTIINAKDMDEAEEIAKGCPGLKREGTVRVYEAMPM